MLRPLPLLIDAVLDSLGVKMGAGLALILGGLYYRRVLGFAGILQSGLSKVVFAGVVIGVLSVVGVLGVNIGILIDTADTVWTSMREPVLNLLSQTL